jgi:hypothetical protein
MLHSYSFSNFQSFREQVSVDLTLSRKTAFTDWMAEADTGEPVSKLMAIMGANGSGKTALLKPVAFVSWFISESFQSKPDAPIPVTPHFARPNEPSTFSFLFDFDGKLWRYELVCTPQRVLHEALYQRRERFGYVFVRDWDEAKQHYAVKQKDFDLPQREARRVRSNASLISTAAQYGIRVAGQLASHNVVTNVDILGRRWMTSSEMLVAAKHFATRPDQKKTMSELLGSWDLGLASVDLREVQNPTEDEPDRKFWTPFGNHVGRDTTASLPFYMESSGTQGAFVLLSRLLPVLASGGLAVIDEFENDLHSHMLEPILDLFANPTTNPKKAQLLFTCHAAEVLNLLNKAQIVLVEKDSYCESTAYRLDSVEGIRSDDNLYAKYMAGAYGGVPRL